MRDPLFHVVVTLGAAAAASACGQAARPQHDATPAAAAGSSSGAESGGVGAGPEIIFPGAGSSGKSAILTDGGAGAYDDTCSGGAANSGVSVDVGAAGAAGDLDDCPSSQLYCASYSPTLTDCFCNRGAPLSACDCSARNRTGWECAVFDPPMGCECVGYITGPK